MRKILFIIFYMTLMLYFGGTYSQTNKNFKLYVNASYKEYSADFINYKYSDKYQKTSDISDVNFGFMSFAYELKNKKGNYHEIEITPFIIKSYDIKDIIFQYADSLTQIVSGSRIIDFETSTSYQYNYSLNKKEDSKVEPYIGLVSNLYYNKKMLSPQVSTIYISKSSVFGFAFSFEPGIKFKLNKKISLDINIPVRFYEYNSGRSIILEPYSSDQTRLSRDIYGKFFPKKYYLRVGLVYHI